MATRLQITECPDLRAPHVVPGCLSRDPDVRGQVFCGAILANAVTSSPLTVRHLTRDTRIWLTFITVAELANWAVMREWDEIRRGRLEAWTAGRPVIPYDARIAQLWGELTGQARLRGRPRPQNHTWIAACCLRYGIPLMALNTADFGDFAEHHGLVLLGDREPERRR